MEFGLKIFAPADRDSALYCLPDGTELEVSCVELIGEEVCHNQNEQLLNQALILYAQMHRTQGNLKR